MTAFRPSLVWPFEYPYPRPISARRAGPTATLRHPASLRSSQYSRVLAFAALRLTDGFAAALPDPTRFAFLLRSRTSHYFL
jgi:hypothetical protein